MKPNNIRLALLIAIFMIFIILYGRYNQQFHPQNQQNNNQPVKTGVKHNKQSAIPTEAIPTKVEDKKEEIPDNIVEKNNSVNINPIEVKTDVLDLKISPDNADIISAKLLKYPTSLENKEPLSILTDKKDIDYISQSGIITSDSEKALHFTSVKSNYNLEDADKLKVVLKANNNHIEVTKTYTFEKSSYNILVETSIKNVSDQTITGRSYNRLTRMEPDSKGGLLSVHSYATYMGAVLSSTSNKYQKESFSDIAKAPVVVKTDGGWAAMVEHYFLTAWIPEGKGENLLYTQKNTQNNSYSVGVVQPEFKLMPNQSSIVKASLYVGPAIKDQLEAAAPNLSYTIDYGLLWFISVIIFWAMAHIHEIIGNWGVSIILVTLLIKVIFYPLSAKSFRSMAKMRLLQPKVKQLRERLGDDRQKMSQAMMELYRREKVSPLGGCLPMLIQIPVFIALYWVLLESVQLRQAPFIFWIHDLSVKDPYYVLPVLMGLSMLLQQRLNPAPPDPIQAKVMMFLPVLFTVMFASFPAGLVLYWLTNNCLTIAQQSWINHRMAKDPKFAGLKKIKKKKVKKDN